jgi:hypothetical protein
VEWANRPHYHAPVRTRSILGVAMLGLAAAACDKDSTPTATAEAAAPVAVATPAPAPEPPRAPDIVIDASNVAIGQNRVAAGEPGLADKVAVFLTGAPAIEGATVSVVAMRPSKPSEVAAVVAALRKAKASGAVIKTEARDNSTQKLPLSLSTSAPDCATVAWIAKDVAVDVWPAGGGTAKRIIKGLAGPDITLGTDAIRKQQAGCSAPDLYVGADDSLPWGLVFDLATAAIGSPGVTAGSGALVTNAVPGRKLVLP